MMRTLRNAVLIASLLVGSAHAGPAALTRVDGVDVELRLDKTLYGLGESVQIALTLANSGKSMAGFEFPTGQMYDFVVVRGSQKIWQWSHGRVFTQAFTTLTLRAGERRVFSEEWDQRGNGGQLVSSGTYEMLAIFPARSVRMAAPTELQGPRVTFTISPRSAGSGQFATIASRSVQIAGTSVGEVLVNGRPVLRIRVAAGGISGPDRATIVSNRLRGFLNAGLMPKELAVARAGNEMAIMWNRQLVVTADSAHARLNNTTPHALAVQWRQSLVTAFSARQ